MGKGGKLIFHSIFSSVVDPHRVDADPDLYLMRIRILFDAYADPGADPDPQH